ncbi:MAG TPA: ATP synthase F1 subunit epsilon [Gemmataceae bacterium]|nr:ATP synthase F1 subunit epsilon [Gemmataceae bacterium]
MAELQAAAGTKPLQCVVVTPERAVLDEPADFVVLPMYDGELGVLPGRAALIGRLGYGELRVRNGHQTQHFYVDGGFAQVRDNVVTVLTGKAVPAADISADAARQALQAALKPATGEALEAALKQQARARAQLRMANSASTQAGGNH